MAFNPKNMYRSQKDVSRSLEFERDEQRYLNPGDNTVTYGEGEKQGHDLAGEFGFYSAGRFDDQCVADDSYQASEPENARLCIEIPRQRARGIGEAGSR